MEDLDLTGQEDPVFLHIAIKSLPVHAAYKEGIARLLYNQCIEVCCFLSCKV